MPKEKKNRMNKKWVYCKSRLNAYFVSDSVFISNFKIIREVNTNITWYQSISEIGGNGLKLIH